MAKTKVYCPNSIFSTAMVMAMNADGIRASAVGAHVITEADIDETRQWLVKHEWDLKHLKLDKA